MQLFYIDKISDEIILNTSESKHIIKILRKKKNDIVFFTDGKGYQQMSPKIDDAKFNLWNSKTWFFNVETGNLFLFPSSTIHQVDIKKGDNTRISLAFNTFYKGVVGSEDSLTELIL